MSAGRRAGLDRASAVFTVAFTAECCAKLLGYGLAGFAGDRMNCFDALVVALSLVDLFSSVRARRRRRRPPLPPPPRARRHGPGV